MSKDNVTRRISIFVNGKEVENSLKGVEGAMAQVRNRMRLLNSDSETYEKDSKELAQTMNQLRERQAAYREELGLTNKAMEEANEISGGLRGTLTGVWDSLVSGDLQGAKEGISAITSGIGGMIKASLTFIATPIGAAIAGLAALGAGAKALFDYNVELNKMNKELKALGVNSSEISAVRSELQATAETFDKDFKEIAEKANSLAKTYGISMSEANQIIAEGLASGGAQNAEFLDSLGEYDEFFAKAGYSAKEFSDIINTGYDLGIYSDKLPDALKEADLALKENTKSTRDALVNAFGASFSDDILNKVKTGELTTKQALDAIALKAQESNLSQQQYAQLTADVFKGAGEDAGGAQKIFEALGQSAKRELDATAQASLRLVDANEKLNKAQSELFEIENFGDIWTGIKAVSTEALASMLEYLADVKKDIQPIIDLVQFAFVYAWENAKLVFVSVFDIISGVIKAFASYFGGIIQGFIKLLQGDFKGAFFAVAEGISNAFKNIGNIFINLYNNVIKFLTNLVDAAAPVLETLGVDVDKLKKKLEGLKGKKFEIKGEVTTTTTENKKTNNQTSGSGGGGATKDALAAEAKARADAAAKQKAEEEKARAEKARKEKEYFDAVVKLGKAEVDFFIANNQSKIDKNGELTQALVDEETKRLADIKQKKLAQLALESGTNEAVIGLKQQQGIALSAEDLNYLTQKQQLELQFQQQTETLKTEFEEQEKAKKAEQLLADKEIKLLEAETEWEAQRIQADERYNTELADLEARKQKGFLTEQQFAALSKDLEARTAEDKIMIARAERDAKVSEYGTMFANIATLLGENTAAGKAAALANVALSQGLAVARIWEQPSTLPSPFDVAAKVTGTAVAVGNVIAAAKQINSVKTPKTTNTKFFYGGSTGTNAALGYDEFGPVTGYVHKNEYVIPEVMTQDPRFANTITWLEANRQSKMRGYVDGGATSPGVVSANPVETSSNETAMLVNAVNNLNAILSSGIMAKVNFGYKDVEEMEDMKNEVTSASQNGTIG